jgi:hypothetical protein
MLRSAAARHSIAITCVLQDSIEFSKGRNMVRGGRRFSLSPSNLFSRSLNRYAA